MAGVCFNSGVCCKLFLINLTEKEYNSGNYKTQFGKSVVFKDFKKAYASGVATLKQKKDGSCIYLKNNLCSIHPRRPQVCRRFFCSSKEKKYQSMVTQVKNYKTGLQKA
jgi:Fe-S-cluster containining protein